ncbi:MAG TPA: helix-turn-helix domain-containing protein [Myxococcota bacterium]|jgi:transcriptional regulator with XRE-family HTH domain|nr:helix-turn-helix domain-containing protein [Myxococcota bacterium]
MSFPLVLTPQDASKALGERARSLRLLENWTRATLARRAGVSEASLKRFETTGKASLDLVLKVAHALGRLDDFARALDPPAARSLAELERQVALPHRKRGRR